MEKINFKVGKDIVTNSFSEDETITPAGANRADFLKKPMLLLVVFMVLNVGVYAEASSTIGNSGATGKSPAASANRPIRNRQNMLLTVGQSEGDLEGDDDKIIQAGIEYLYRLGGGTLHVLPGIYNLRNAIYLRPNITLKGSGEKTILKKTPSVVTALARDSDWFEYGVQVTDIKGFIFCPKR